ncbi:hypothetical protein DV737_g4472, partial [Chaetothyriales sp. CBS 132003]
MAALTASPPAVSPPPLHPSASSHASLPPLLTGNPGLRHSSSQRPASWTARRLSSYSAASKASRQHESRPASYVFPVVHSSLEYCLVRDFAYAAAHPMHYGGPPPSDTSTPVSESRRLSDPVVANWEDSRRSWSATPPWMADDQQANDRDQLPAMSFSDGGPPYSEDEDLHSPIVTTSKKKDRSQAGVERGRSPGAAGPDRGRLVDSDEQDGPGGAIENYPRRYPAQPQHRDSNFAKPLNRGQSPREFADQIFEDDVSEEDAARYSKDYSFTIASPDEEMHGKAVALFDFESEHPNELALKEGQIILVSYRHGQGWLVAEDPRTGESGLVPEEFVRLVRDIEGGLNGLNAMTLDDHGDGALSPVSIDPGSASTPTQGQQEFPHHAPKLSGEKHPPVQSTFSTRRADFLPVRGDDERSPAAVLRESSQGRQGHETL